MFKFSIKDVTDSIEKQHELLKLIVQKMEIHSEAENQDEGTTATSFVSGDSTPMIPSSKNNGWSNPKLRGQLIRQANAVAQFSKSSPSQSST